MRYGFTVLKDPSEVWTDLPMKHPKYPSDAICRNVDMARQPEQEEKVNASNIRQNKEGSNRTTKRKNVKKRKSSVLNSNQQKDEYSCEESTDSSDRDMDYFSKGNEFEIQRDWSRALQYYRKALSQERNPQIIYHLAVCLSQEATDAFEETINFRFGTKTVSLLEQVWRYCTSSSFKEARRRWKKGKELKIQLISGAACCHLLAEHHREVQCGYNDCSLLWLTRAMALLRSRQTRCIHTVKVTSDQLMKSDKCRHSTRLLNRNEKTWRERINDSPLGKESEYALRITEKIVLKHEECIVEKLHGSNYVDVNLDECAVELRKDKEHLRKELDSIFEIGVRHQWRTIYESDVSAFYLNYAVILKDVYGKLEEAKEWFHWALHSNPEPDDSTIYINLEELYKEMNQPEKAAKYRLLTQELDRANALLSQSPENTMNNHNTRKRTLEIDDDAIKSSKRQRRGEALF